MADLLDWVLPYWLDRQLSPMSAAFVAGAWPRPSVNVTHRNWTVVGTVGSVHRGTVDPRGMVTTRAGGWSLDWWIGADDRWHLPSRESAVRQALLGGTPVVETSMRVPGGDAVHRAYAVPAADGRVVVEIENRSPAPFSVALAIRPFHPEGLAWVERIALDGTVVVVDGLPGVLLPGRPFLVAASTGAEGDVADPVLDGDAASELADPVHCPAGLASAAFLFPLAHTATMRLALPIMPEPFARHRRGRGRREPEPEPPVQHPSAGAVARSWIAQTRRGLRLELPAGPLRELTEANRRFLLLCHQGERLSAGPGTAAPAGFRDAARVITTLDRFGFHREAAEVLRTYSDRQQLDGSFICDRPEADANGAAIYALAEHWRLTDDLDVVDLETVTRGVGFIELARTGHATRRTDPARRGLMPGVPGARADTDDHLYRDDFWSLKGLLDGGVLLRAGGQQKAAERAEGWAAGLREAIEQSLTFGAGPLGGGAIPAGPGRGIDPAAVGSLAACWPLGLLDATDIRVAATADALRRRWCVGAAFFDGVELTGLAPSLTLQLAFVELAAGDARALERLEWMVQSSTSTATWPEAIHPRVGGGTAGDGHDGGAAADFLSFVRALLVREIDGGLALCSMLPAEWVGQGLEVHAAPTHAGRLSFAVRWHGERPALLWDLVPHPGRQDPVPITAPGLDPTFSTTALRGETLLQVRADA